jgi:hypothetical protein
MQLKTMAFFIRNMLVMLGYCLNLAYPRMLSVKLVEKLITEADAKQMCFFGNFNSDQDISTLVQLSKNTFQSCEITQNVLILIYNVNDQQLHEILKNASQRQLRNNIWMVISSENTISTDGRKLGLRAQLYQLSLDNNTIIHLTQYFGTGSSFLKLKVQYVQYYCNYFCWSVSYFTGIWTS